MINFRFHLISLVAVFLALGVGVAMGASFVDRATVDSLRGRIDDLDSGFRERGQRIAQQNDQLVELDRQATALADPGSAALATRLRGQPVVLVVPEGTPGDLLDATRVSLAAAEAVTSGTVRIAAALSLDDEGTVRRVRDRLGVRTGTASALRNQVVSDLGTALGVLGAGAEPAPLPDAAPPGGAEPGDGTYPAGQEIADAAAARAFLAALQELGLISVDAGDAPAGAAFPDAGPFRYLEILPTESRVDSAEVLVPLAESLSARAPLTLTVASAQPARPEGAATTTVPDGSPELLAILRAGGVRDRLSTVDDLQEPFGRIAVVYAIAQQRNERVVGHYGTGPEASAPFPTVPAG
jgi:hypothetical protein